MTDTQVTARDALRAEILAEVAAEQAEAWAAERASEDKLKVKRLDHGRELPDTVALWNNLPPEKDPPRPGLGDVLGYEYRNELGDAELYQRMQAGKYALDHSVGKNGTWMEYDGVVWKVDAVAHARRLAMTTLPEVYESAATYLKGEYDTAREKYERQLDEVKRELDTAQADEDPDVYTVQTLRDKQKVLEREFSVYEKDSSSKRKRLRDRARALRTNMRATNVLKTASSGKSSLGLDGDGWDKYPNLFAVANGVVDLETGRLIRSRSGLYLQKSSPYPYIGLSALSRWWDDHLGKVFCYNYELIDYFEWSMGYSITGIRHNKDIWVAYGPQADNGKSATFNTIKDVVGGYATTIKVDLLLDDGMPNKGPDPDIMVINALRLGLASEAGEKAKFIERIKAITGGDDVRARGLYTDSKVIDSFVKLWLHTNSIPNMSGYDPGFKLRLKIVPFSARFTTREDEVCPERNVYRAMNQNAFKMLQKQEAPYVLAWLLRCARKFYMNPDYKPPQCVTQSRPVPYKVSINGKLTTRSTYLLPDDPVKDLAVPQLPKKLEAAPSLALIESPAKQKATPPPVHKFYRTLGMMKDEMVVFEAAIAGSEMGQPLLEEALRMKALRIVNTLERLMQTA